MMFKKDIIGMATVLLVLVGFSACSSNYAYRRRGFQVYDQADGATTETRVSKGQQTRAKSDATLNVPAWYATPPVDPSYIYGVSSQTSVDLQIAINKASAAARVDIGRQVKVKIQALQKRYAEDIGTDEQSELSSLFTEVEKTIVSVSLSGSRIREQSFSKEGKNWRAFVLVEYPIADIEHFLTEQAQKTNNQTLLKKQFAETRMHARKAFQELEEAVGEKPKETEKSVVADVKPTEDPKAATQAAAAPAPTTIETEDEPINIPPPSNRVFNKEVVPISTGKSEKLKTDFVEKQETEDDYAFLEKKPLTGNSFYFGYYGSKQFSTDGVDNHYGYIGYERAFMQNRFGFLSELHLGINRQLDDVNNFSMMAMLGLRWNIISAGSWDLGITGKLGIVINANKSTNSYYFDNYGTHPDNSSLGISESSISQGTRKEQNVASHYYSPYYNNTNNEGDYKQFGFVTMLGLSTKYRFTEKFYLIADIGYTYLLMGPSNGNSYMAMPNSPTSSHNLYFGCGLGFNF